MPLMSDDNGAPPVRRVLMAADTTGRILNFSLELVSAFQESGVEVALALMGDPLDARTRAAIRCMPNVELFESTYKLEWMHDAWGDVEVAGAWLLDLENRIQPDVIHLNGYAHGSLPWRAPSLVVGHSCVVSWFRSALGHYPPPAWDRYEEEVRRGLRAADLVTAPTHAMLSSLRDCYGSFHTGEVVAHGRNAGEFRPRRKKPFVLTAGRVGDEGRNIAGLARIAPRLPWPVYVAGHEDCDTGTADRSDRSAHPGSGDKQDFHPLGRLAPEEMAAWMGRAAIFAMPARYEPFGLVALEAALAGCALVLGNIRSLREVWGSGAMYVDPDDEEELAAALHRLITNDSLRQQYATHARKRALGYTPQRMARGYLALYRQLVERSRRYRSEPVTAQESAVAP